MKNGFKLMLTIGLGAGLQCGAAEIQPARVPAAPSGPPTMMAPPVQAPPVTPSCFKDQKEYMSYSIGMWVGKSVKQGGVELDLEVLAAAMRDMAAGKETKITEPQMIDGLKAHTSLANAKREEERLKTAEKNKKAGEEFLAENKKKEGIKTQSVTTRDGKTAEMQYRVITEGNGPLAKSNEVLTVNFRCSLIGGKECMNTASRGGPTKYSAGRAMPPGLNEALMMMKVGSKWELFLPAQLGWGDAGMREIEPGSTLIYEVELVSAEAPPAMTAPPAAGQPLTSDIIRVPSADEIKKGAKPEIIKAEDVEKRIQAEKAATDKK